MSRMKTRFIGMRELRQNLSMFMEEMRKKNLHFIILRHGKIAGHVMPPTEDENLLQELAEDISIAREEAKRGEGRSSDEVRKLLDL